jgi:protocatechuate 3,4-dioxygenase, alpha subunit
MGFSLTPSQTIGPFFKPSLIWPELSILVNDNTRGERIIIEGRILDGDGAPVDDAMVEIWQANAEGRYDHPEDTQEKLLDPNFHGFGRTATDEGGGFRFETIKPGPVPGNGGTLQAPHINVTIFSRGLLKHVVTRIYFPDEPLNANDPVLNAVPRDRRSTLIARAEDAAQKRLYRFDVILQGNKETVFFDI